MEGHHLSINFSIADGKVASGTPIFFASNPAEVLEGPRKGLKVLASEEDIARSLVRSLDAEQRKAHAQLWPNAAEWIADRSTVKHR